MSPVIGRTTVMYGKEQIKWTLHEQPGGYRKITFSQILTYITTAFSLLPNTAFFKRSSGDTEVYGDDAGKIDDQFQIRLFRLVFLRGLNKVA